MPGARHHLPSTTRLACSVVLAALLLGSPASGADSARNRARSLFLKARDLYNQKDYPAALTHFQRASRIYRSYKIDLSIGFTLEKLGRLTEAAAYYERFLIDRSRPTDNDVEDTVLGKLERIRHEVATVSLDAKVRGAVVVLDNEARHATPLQHRLYLAPGRHRITVERADRVLYARRVKLRAGQHLKIRPDRRDGRSAAQSEEKPWLTGAQPVPSSARPFYKQWWFWTAVGVVVVGATVGLAVSAEGGDDWLPSGDSGTIDLSQ
jgi:hypothetical protein